MPQAYAKALFFTVVLIKGTLLMANKLTFLRVLTIGDG